MKKTHLFRVKKKGFFIILLMLLPALFFAQTDNEKYMFPSSDTPVDDSVADTGYESSIAIDLQGDVHISYFDATNGDLKYARHRKGGEVVVDSKNMNARNYNNWISFTIDSRAVVGKYSSIKTDSLGRPCISYYDVTNKALKYARYDGLKWIIQYVDAGNVGMYTSLVLDKSDRPGISYYDAENKSLKYAAYDGTNWNAEEVDRAPGGDLGLYTSIVMGSDDRPRIAYYDSGKGKLKFAKLQGNSWDIEDVDNEENAKVGAFASLALGKNDTPYIAYYDLTNTALKYAKKTGFSWEKLCVDKDGSVGQFASLAIDNYGNPKIAYYDSGKRQLKLSEWRGSKWFVGYPVSQYGYFGMDCSMVLDKQGYWHLSYRELQGGKICYSNNMPIEYFNPNAAPVVRPKNKLQLKTATE